MEGCAVCGVHTTSLCTNKYSNKRVKKRGKKTTKITAFVCGASVCIAVVLAMALHRCGAFFSSAAVGNYGYFLRFLGIFRCSNICCVQNNDSRRQQQRIV